MNNASILWEETDSTEQSKKSESKLISGQNDGINETKNVSVGSVCEDTGTKKKWTRNCPKCNREIVYYTNGGYKRAFLVNRCCRSCINTRSLQTNDNYIGKKFGKITITNQYYPKTGGILRVDFICECGHEELNKQFRTVRNRTMCVRCSRRLPLGIAAFNKVWSYYVLSAKRRKLKFELTKDGFKKLTKQNCVYCGTAPNNIMKPTIENLGNYVYNGIDRRDNNLGYTTENCVPACKNCNFFKFQLTQDDFLNHVKKIYEHQFVEDRRRR